WVKEQAAARADHVTVLADASKLGEHAPAWLAMEESWTLVTDAGVPVEAIEELTARGVVVRQP
ncbi:MAG TPA: hypothetical protein VF728_08735, partial [Nocardioides sp.]